MLCPTRKAAMVLSQFNIPTFLYLFYHSPSNDPINNSTFCKHKVKNFKKFFYGKVLFRYVMVQI